MTDISDKEIEQKEKVIIVYKYYKSPSLAAVQKRYAQRHPEKIREIQKNYYEKNKEKITKRRRELRALKKLEDEKKNVSINDEIKNVDDDDSDD